MHSLPSLNISTYTSTQLKTWGKVKTCINWKITPELLTLVGVEGSLMTWPGLNGGGLG